MKTWLKRFMPDPQHILQSSQLSVLGRRLHDPRLWSLNRRSASGAFGAGLFLMYMPPSGQMLMAAGAAVVLRVNLPLSVALVWISNPLTIPPMFYFAYLVGSWILGTAPLGFDLDSWGDWRNWNDAMLPLGLGMLVCGTVCGTLGYFGLRGLWRWHLVRQIRRRKARRYRTTGSTSEAAAGASTPSSSRQIRSIRAARDIS
jgi:uncharacterized protein (DUF2062 family)